MFISGGRRGEGERGTACPQTHVCMDRKGAQGGVFKEEKEEGGGSSGGGGGGGGGGGVGCVEASFCKGRMSVPPDVTPSAATP